VAPASVRARNVDPSVLGLGTLWLKGSIRVSDMMCLLGSSRS
jgi:hypothetical protein